MIKIKNTNQLTQAAKEFAELIGENKIIAFYGEMGAGKTTLIKAFCENLGVKENITSPTFALVNEYVTEREDTIYHFDFYRVEKEDEAYDMGVEEYFYSGNLCLIEWPEKIKSILPAETLKIKISEVENQERIVEILD